MTEHQKQVDNLMRTLKISAQEAEELIAYDDDVEHDKKTQYDLSKEQEKETRKYRQADRKPFVPKLTTRQRKPNVLKGKLIAAFADFLDTFTDENDNFIVENLEITNKERQISFQIGEEKFDLTLIQKRKPKN